MRRLLCLVLILMVSVSPVVHAGGDHSHDHSHDHGSPGHDCSSHHQSDAVRALVQVIDEYHEAKMRGSADGSQLIEIRERLADVLVLAVDEAQEDARLHSGLSGLKRTIKEQRDHILSHFNVDYIGRMIEKYYAKGGATLVVAYMITESSDTLALIAAPFFHNQPEIAAALAAYGLSHGGEILFLPTFAAILATPYVIAWLNSRYSNYGIKMFSRFREQVGMARSQIPIDWSLTPYVDGEFIVLESTSGLFKPKETLKRALATAPEFLRTYADIRRQLQEQSYPTLYASELERAAKNLGLTTPRSSLPFLARASILIELLRRSPEGTEALSQLVSAAYSKIQTPSAVNGGGNRPFALAMHRKVEQARATLSRDIEQFAAKESGIRYRPQYLMHRETLKELRSILNHLGHPMVFQDDNYLNSLMNRAAKLLVQVQSFDFHSEERLKSPLFVENLALLNAEDAQVFWKQLEWNTWQTLGIARDRYEHDYKTYWQQARNGQIADRARPAREAQLKNTHEKIQNLDRLTKELVKLRQNYYGKTGESHWYWHKLRHTAQQVVTLARALSPKPHNHCSVLLTTGPRVSVTLDAAALGIRL